MTLVENIKENQTLSPFDLSSDAIYRQWRTAKLDISSQSGKAEIININQLEKPTKSECDALVRLCKTSNFALYTTDSHGDDPNDVRVQLRGFADRLGLQIAEKHRSAGEQGIVALTVSDKESQRGYIPYSRKAMNWHTDGYYNAPSEQILAMVLHCVRPATDGGVNQLLDPEIAYIRLRDENPAFIEALMHPEAMSIPENREADGSVRPVSVGPVFCVDPNSNRLIMRYTARTRSISWRDDPTTKKAVAFLQNLLENGDPYMQEIKFGPGQGVLCNNVLHNRTGFDRDNENNNKDSGRLMFRVRFHNRVEGS